MASVRDPVGEMAHHLFFRDVNRPLPVIERAEGIYLYGEDGRRYIDACAGSLVANIGHGREQVAAVLAEQARKVAFTHLSRWANRPALQLADMIASLTPGDLNWVYFVSGGSEATETAIKMARQYYLERDGQDSKRYKVIARWTSYHGATLGALSMTGHVPRRYKFQPLLADFPHIAPAYCYRCPFGKTYPDCNLECAADLEQAILTEGPETVAAFIAEPVVGAAGGAIVPPPGYFERVRQICDKYDILFIADEVMTGFGRTGKMFAIEHWNVVPDIMCVGKGMSAGYAPLGAVIVRERVHRVFKEGSGRFTHGHTYGGNPLSCAVGIEVIRILLDERLTENAAHQGEYFLARLREVAARHDIVGDVRGLGLMLGMELVREKTTRAPFPPEMGMAERVTRRLVENGMVVYPGQGCAGGNAGDQFLIGPPLNVTPREIDEMVSILDLTLAEVEAELPGA